MTIIKCNNCETQYKENQINIVECTKCKTDEYLMELVTPLERLGNILINN
jgi:Zn ribbon nucleic-acid-binding protein